MKLYCPKCYWIVFALRYFKADKKWYKPKGKKRYCEKCDIVISEKECLNILEIKEV